MRLLASLSLVGVTLLGIVAACSGDSSEPSTVTNSVPEAGADGATPSASPDAQPSVAPPLCENITDAGDGGLYPTLCRIAATCGWLDAGHPELESSEAACLERHKSSPGRLTGYMTGFDACILQAAACGSCEALQSCYTRPDLAVRQCNDYARCVPGFDASPADCEKAGQPDPTGRKRRKFDHACPVWCLEQLPANAPCAEVTECARACQ